VLFGVPLMVHIGICWLRNPIFFVILCIYSNWVLNYYSGFTPLILDYCTSYKECDIELAQDMISSEVLFVMTLLGSKKECVFVLFSYASTCCSLKA